MSEVDAEVQAIRDTEELPGRANPRRGGGEMAQAVIQAARCLISHEHIDASAPRVHEGVNVIVFISPTIADDDSLSLTLVLMPKASKRVRLTGTPVILKLSDQTEPIRLGRLNDGGAVAFCNLPASTDLCNVTMKIGSLPGEERTNRRSDVSERFKWAQVQHPLISAAATSSNERLVFQTADSSLRAALMPHDTTLGIQLDADPGTWGDGIAVIGIPTGEGDGLDEYLVPLRAYDELLGAEIAVPLSRRGKVDIYLPQRPATIEDLATFPADTISRSVMAARLAVHDFTKIAWRELLNDASLQDDLGSAIKDALKPAV